MNILLILHIFSMVAGLLLAASLTVAAALGVRSVLARSAVYANVALNIAGLASGALLLLSHPLGSRCAVLLAYLVVFTLSHRYVMRRRAYAFQSIE